jgi:PAS domain S-box-containing protein
MVNDLIINKNLNYYKAIFDNSLNAIFITIPDGTILDANTAAVTIFGYSVEEMRQGGRALIFDHTHPHFVSLVNARDTAGMASGEVIGITKNGRRFPCDISSVVYTDEDGQTRSVVSVIDVSERKAIADDLFTRQQLLTAVVNNSNDGIAVTDKSGQFLIFNDVMASLLGFVPENSVTFDWAKKVNIYDIEGVALVPTQKLPIVRALNGETVKDEVYLVKNPVKGKVYVSISASPIRDKDGAIIGSLVVDKDITQQIIYEQNLKKTNKELISTLSSLLVSNERYKHVLRVTNDAIWDMDLHTYQIQWGDGYQKLFGYGHGGDEATYKEWQSKIHADDRERVTKSLIKSFAKDSPKIWEQEYRYYKSDGTIAHVYDRGYVVYDTDHKPIRMVGAMQDITSRKQYESERTRLIDDLLQQNTNLEQFTYMVSHNLRSQVANIMGCTEMLKDGDLDKDEMESLVNGLASSVGKMDVVIKDLNTILQLKSNVNDNKEPVNLAEIFDDVKSNLSAQIEQSQAVIKSDLQVVNINSVKPFIYSIFLNLVSNSIKYRKENIPALIEVASWREDDKLLLRFKDNGLGIDLAAKGQHLFGLYKRFHTHVEGKGLGLFMVKTQIETLKGKIAVSSTPQGTTFDIELPL